MDKLVVRGTEINVQWNPANNWDVLNKEFQCPAVSGNRLYSLGIHQGIAHHDTKTKFTTIDRYRNNANLVLIADTGSPKGEDSRIVGYSELSWDRDADIPAGVYKATVTIEVVAGN